MPPVALAVAIAAASYAAGVITLTAAILSVVSTVIMTGLQMLMAPKPQTPQAVGLQNLGNFSQTVKQPITAHRIVYGQIRAGGPLAYVGSSEGNLYLHMISVLAAHEVDSIDEVWLDSNVIPNDYLDDGGNVITGTYSGFVRIKKHLGTAAQAADSDLVAEVSEWTTDHKLSGMAYIYVRLKFNQDVFPSGIPNASAIMRAKKLLDPRDGMTKFSCNGALMCHDYMISKDYGFGTATRNISADNISAQANICDEIVDSVNLDTNIVSVDATSDIITLEGDHVPVQTGDRCEIVTAGTPPGGLATATDYYVFVYQFRGSPRVKLATSLANAQAQTAINITSSGTGSFILRRTGEPRYHGAGIIDTSIARKNNFQDMLSMIAGKGVYAGGAWRLLCGAWSVPVNTYSQAEFIAPVQLQTKLSMSDRFNQVQGNFVTSINDFQPSTYPLVKNSSYVADDGGVDILRSLDLPFTNRGLTAQRIALIGLLQSRQELSLSTQFNLKGMREQTGENIGLDSTRYGWSDKPFELINFGLGAESGDEGSPPRPYIAVTVRETDSSVFDWDPNFGTEIDPAPNSNLPNPFVVAAPTGVSFSSRSTITVSGDTVYNLVLAWTVSGDQFVVAGGHYEIQYKQSADTDWRPYPNVPGDQTLADITFNSIGVAYDIRIRAVNNLGVRSTWNQLTGAIVGSSGGVGATVDWGNWTDSVGTSANWGNWTDSVSPTADWGFYT